MKAVFFSWLILSFSSRASFAAYDPQHGLWDQIVLARVKAGVVDYVGVKADGAKLDQYLAQLAEVTEPAYEKWSTKEKMAYLINAYNAFTLKMISDFYPVESIRDIGGKVGGNLFNKRSKQWNVSEYNLGEKKVVFKAMGKAVTLDEIEHENLRPKFKDPRVHFALVCGAVSCPFLRSEAYTASKLDEQLDAQGRQFLADPFRNRFDAAKNTLYLSMIFKWFSGDFKQNGTVQNFVKNYLPEVAKAKVSDNTEIEYVEYDWSLNSRAGSAPISKAN